MDFVCIDVVNRPILNMEPGPGTLTYTREGLVTSWPSEQGYDQSQFYAKLGPPPNVVCTQ